MVWKAPDVSVKIRPGHKGGGERTSVHKHLESFTLRVLKVGVGL